ncbi:zinc ribbon domain-containing protein [Polaribacter sp.]|uniref:zinc ribbon domain-containing protein n=1 Tax=Polaribacter sp. TaxID=1920175 RepID=UPI003EF94356
MEYLPHEFVQFAQKKGVSENAILNLLGAEFSNSTLADDEDISWRKIPDIDSLDDENWRLLENFSKVYQLKKIARRRVFSSNNLYYNQTLDKVSLFEFNKYNAIRFETFKTKKEFVDNLTEKYVPYKSFAYKLPQLNNLSKDEWFIIVSLLELFIEKNPIPNSTYTPDELFVFTPDSLLQLIKNSSQRKEEYTWWGHWQKLSEHKIPTIEEIETAILVLVNKALAGYLEQSEKEDVYFVGKELVGIMNALAWWDRGFVIESEPIATKLYLFQADSLFVLVNENNKNYSLFNIDGEQLPNLLSNFMNVADKPNTAIDQKEPRKKINFCSNCGSSVIPGTKFCSNCGNKLN